jgi:pyruvate/oxaloacetate carboxyltransferase
MTISVASEEGRQIVDGSRIALQELAGSTLSFAALSRLLNEDNTARLAEIVAILSSTDVQILKRVFFFDDENYGLVPVSDIIVKHYLVQGQFYHPVTKLEIEFDDLDDRIIIEFEVV